jgi:Tol biopolymer transport system component
MSDERLIRDLRALDRSVDVDPAFGDALFAILEGEFARRRQFSPRLTLLLVAALVAALLVGGAIAVGSGLLRLPRTLPEPGRLALEHGVESIVSINPDGTGFVSVSEATGGGRDLTVAWSPDGTRLAFVRVAAAGPSDDIIVLDYPGFTSYQNLGAGDLGGLSWSPDSRRIAFWSADGLVVVNADGSGRRSLPSNGCGSVGGLCSDGTSQLSWSPDGSRVLVSNRLGDLVTVDVATAAITVVLRAAERANRASIDGWSPDGRQLVFVSGGVASGETELSNAQVEVVNVDGTGRRSLHVGANPTWSPTGEWIAFDDIQPEPEPHGVYVIRPDGNDLRFVGDGRRPAWAPDGSAVAYCGHDDAGSAYFVADLAGGETRVLLRDSCWYGGGPDISWQPLTSERTEGGKGASQ